MTFAKRLRKFYRLDMHKPEMVTTSRLVNRGWLIGIRSVLCIYSAMVWISIVVGASIYGFAPIMFTYFTLLSYTGIVAYQISATTHLILSRKSGVGRENSFSRLPQSLQLLHWLLYESTITFAFVVSIIYWCFLFEISDLSIPAGAWLDISAHALNIFTVVVEFIFNNETVCPHWSHITTLSLVMILYLSLTWITETFLHRFPYFLLDYRRNKWVEAGILTATLAGVVVVYYLWYGLHLFRNKFISKREPPVYFDEISLSPRIHQSPQDAEKSSMQSYKF